MKTITTTIIALICALSYSQEKELGTRIMLNTDGVSESSFYVYNPVFEAKAIYKNITQAKNEYPEQLMSSIMSEITQEWVDYNTLGGKEKAEVKDKGYFDRRKKIDKDKNYFELQAKLEFKANGNDMAIMKFYLHQKDKEKPIAGALVLQKTTEGWKQTSTPYTTNMAMAIMAFKPDVMKRLLSGESINDFEKRIIDAVYGENGFSFSELLKHQLTDEEREALTNPLNW